MTSTRAETKRHRQPPVFVSVPYLRVWVRDRAGANGCDGCGGRRARVCLACRGQGGCWCSLDYEHACRTCHGTGFAKCTLCTSSIEWEQIPRPLVRLCGVKVSAWDLLDELALVRALVVRAEAEGESLRLRAKRNVHVVGPPPYYEPHKNQPILEYPAEQLVLSFGGAR